MRRLLKTLLLLAIVIPTCIYLHSVIQTTPQNHALVVVFWLHVAAWVGIILTTILYKRINK